MAGAITENAAGRMALDRNIYPEKGLSADFVFAGTRKIEAHTENKTTREFWMILAVKDSVI
jgi:hypothetical protein